MKGGLTSERRIKYPRSLRATSKKNFFGPACTSLESGRGSAGGGGDEAGREEGAERDDATGRGLSPKSAGASPVSPASSITSTKASWKAASPSPGIAMKVFPPASMVSLRKRPRLFCRRST